MRWNELRRRALPESNHPDRYASISVKSLAETYSSSVILTIGRNLHTEDDFSGLISSAPAYITKGLMTHIRHLSLAKSI